ncbi:GNAT family N-acetyltransferase [Clostridiaceae bacterium HSG29]|nr:GNAT family N-acetyltransferase [Clostridiaceae bacterium HSG29]
MKIKIEKMSIKNLRDIFEFELENKEYFEKTLLPRPCGYFNYEEFIEIMTEILEEQSKHECLMYIIRDLNGKMVGRVNLTLISLGSIRKAEIGYRIGEESQGKGYATESVKLIMLKGFKEYKLTVFEAGTSTKNIGSQKVLENNGFKKISKEEKVMKINGKWIDGYLYEYKE